MSGAGSTAARPTWAHEGVKTITTATWPCEADAHADRRVRVSTFETNIIAPETREERGDWVKSEGRTITARLDEGTNQLWVRFDRHFGDSPGRETALTRVETDAVWYPFRHFQTHFPRSRMPYRSAAATIFNRSCNRRILDADERDDHEEEFLGDTAEEDKRDPEGLLSYRVQRWEMDEELTRQAWEDLSAA